MTRRSSPWPAALLLACLCGPATAAGLEAVYQDISLGSCRDLNPTPPAKRGDHESSPYACPPFRGYGVSYVSLPNAAEFRIDPRGGKQDRAQLRFLSGLGPRIEWRVSRTASGIAPKAAIVRTQVYGDGGKIVPVLNVLKVETGQVCLAAVVDAAANKSANDLARQAADGSVQAFRCGSTIEIVGVETEASRTARDQ